MKRLPREFKLGFCSLLFCLSFSGCHIDRSPTLSADIQFINIACHPQKLGKSFLPDQYLASCFTGSSVAVFSIARLAVIKTLAVQKGPSSLISDPGRKNIYCLHTQENAVAVLGGDPLRVKKSFGTGPISLAGGTIRPGNEELWICDGISSVYILVLPGLQLKKKLSLGRYPQNLIFSEDGAKAYITIKGENAVVVLDAKTGEKLASLKLGIYPSDIARVGKIVCVSNFGSHDISLIDMEQDKELLRIRVREQPNSLAVVGQTLWVSCEQSYRLSAIDVTQRKVTGTIKLGFYPGNLLALDDGSLLVADPRHDRVAIVRLKTAQEAAPH